MESLYSRPFPALRLPSKTDEWICEWKKTTQIFKVNFTDPESCTKFARLCYKLWKENGDFVKLTKGRAVHGSSLFPDHVTFRAVGLRPQLGEPRHLMLSISERPVHGSGDEYGKQIRRWVRQRGSQGNSPTVARAATFRQQRESSLGCPKLEISNGVHLTATRGFVILVPCGYSGQRPLISSSLVVFFSITVSPYKFVNISLLCDGSLVQLRVSTYDEFDSRDLPTQKTEKVS